MNKNLIYQHCLATDRELFRLGFTIGLIAIMALPLGFIFSIALNIASRFWWVMMLVNTHIISLLVFTLSYRAIATLRRSLIVTSIPTAMIFASSVICEVVFNGCFEYLGETNLPVMSAALCTAAVVQLAWIVVAGFRGPIQIIGDCQCFGCGYLLADSTATRCPECGAVTETSLVDAALLGGNGPRL